MTSVPKTQSKHVSFESYIERFIFIPPDGGWGWIIVVASFTINFIVDGIINTFGMYFDDVGASFNVEPTKVAVTSSIMNGIYLLMGPLTCSLANRFGFRAVALTGGLLGTATFLVTSYSKNITSFIMIIGIFGGFSFNMLFSSGLIMVGFYFEKWRALTTSISITGGCIGSLIFPLIISNLFRDLEWTQKFRVLSILIFGAGLLTVTFIPLKTTKVIEVRKPGLPEKQLDIIQPDDQDISPVSSTTEVGVDKKARCFLFRIFENSSYEITSHENTHFQDKKVQAPSVYIFHSQFSLDSTISMEEEMIQIVLNQTESREKRNRFCSFCFRNDRSTLKGPLYRDDIFYTGSIFVLPQYKTKSPLSELESQKFSASLGYHLSVTRKITQTEIRRNKNRCGYFCDKAVIQVLMMMLDFRLIKSPSFLVLALSGFFTMVGYYIPYVFIIQRGKEIGLSNEWCTLLLTIIGVSSTLGTITCGVISCFPKVDILSFSYVTLFIAGAVTIASSFWENLRGQITFAIMYGFNITSFVTLRSVLIANLVGLEALTNAIGISFLCFGIANIIGISASAYLRSITGTYRYSFVLAGSTIGLSAILLIPVMKISVWEKKRNKTVL